MYAVVGVTGHTGRAVAEELLRKGEKVRAVVRDAAREEEWKAKGAEVSVADLNDAAALAKAFSGTKGAYVLIPPQYGVPDYLAAARGTTDSVAAALRQSGIAHVVLLSSIGAQHPEGTGPIRSLHYAERILGEAAKNLTALRAAYFLENWGQVLGEVREKGMLPSFLKPGRAIPMVATRDIGRAAADALLDPPKGRRVIELSGPREFTPEDVAASLGAKLGRKVEVQGLPIEAVEPAMKSMGITPDLASLYREMIDGVNRGHVDWEGGGAVARRGRLGPADVLGPMLG